MWRPSRGLSTALVGPFKLLNRGQSVLPLTRRQRWRPRAGFSRPLSCREAPFGRTGAKARSSTVELAAHNGLVAGSTPAGPIAARRTAGGSPSTAIRRMARRDRPPRQSAGWRAGTGGAGDTCTGCRRSSVVEHDLAKVGVGGSTPFARPAFPRIKSGVRLASQFRGWWKAAGTYCGGVAGSG